MTLSDVVIVLSRPAEAGNVGAVCRGMKNMGLRRLRIAAAEAEFDDAVVRARAVHAADLWDGAEFFPTLSEALADCSLVVGTTRRMGKKRKDFTLTPRELAEALRERSGRAAILFGNERTGLESEELALCHLASHIPSDEAFPSLNLSHAVQIYAYELWLALERASGGRWVPLDAAALEGVASDLADSLQEVGFYTQAGRGGQELFFRDILARAGVTLDESRYLRSIFRKMARLAELPEEKS